MANSASFELQKVIYTRLDSALSVPVVDHPEENTAYPYVTIGHDMQVDWSSKTTTGERHAIRIHAWSRYNGMKELKELVQEVKDALHLYDVGLAGHTLVFLRYKDAIPMDDPDGVTKHAVIRFEALTQQD